MTSNFRRGRYKGYGSSEVWDPGEEDEARTSFRSTCSASSELEDIDRHQTDVYRRTMDGDGLREISKPASCSPLVTQAYQQYGRQCGLNRPGELDDILEESDDGDGEEMQEPSSGEISPAQSRRNLSSPSLTSSNSARGSFRMISRDQLELRSSQESDSSRSASGKNSTFKSEVSTSDGRGVVVAKRNQSESHRPNRISNNHQLLQFSNHRGQDSGFSDSGDSEDKSMVATLMGSPGGCRDGDEDADDYCLMHSEEEGANVSHVRNARRSSGVPDNPFVRSEVVHETRTSFHNHKQYHVSKVYFYSVTDVLNSYAVSGDVSVLDDETDGYVSILDCETGAIKRGCGQDPAESSFMSSTLLQHDQNDSFDSDSVPELDPNACDLIPDDQPVDQPLPYHHFMEHKPLHPLSTSPSSSSPFEGSPSHGIVTKKNKESSVGFVSPSRSTSAASTSPGISLNHSGSLFSSTKSHQSSPCPSNSDKSVASTIPHPFPKTNGSLYESMSFVRPSSTGGSNDQRRTTHQRGSCDATLCDDLDVAMTGARFKSTPSNNFNFSRSSNDVNSNLDPVQFWLKELSFVHESECTIMLQSKPVDDYPGSVVGRVDSSISSPDVVRSGNLRLCSVADDQLQRFSGDLDESGGETEKYLWTGNSKDTIRAIQSRAHSISAVFAKLCKQLGYRGVSKLVPLVQGLSHQINLFLVEYNNLPMNLPGFRPHQNIPSSKASSDLDDSCAYSSVPEEVLHQQRLLLQACDKLKLNVSRCMMLQSNGPPSPIYGCSGGSHLGSNESSVVDVITQLGATFTKLIELMLSKEIKSCVERLNDRKSILVLQMSVDNLITLALEGNHICRLIAKHGGVRNLLEICIDENLRTARVNAFRALGTVCCVIEGVVELQMAGGIEVLTDTLDPSNLREVGATEEEKSEAAGLLAQVTSPWIENRWKIHGLGQHLDKLVQSLTALCERTQSAETFLLASAALANLTFMEPAAVRSMKRYNTVGVLVSAVSHAGNRKSYDGRNGFATTKGASIYIQDQIAAVLANMAADSECRKEVVLHGGLPVLLGFLDARCPSNPEKSEELAQVAAAERVLQKSAIAISRLCNDPSLAREVVELGGLGRLVELCKNENSRVSSDGVLVACLAAVRKISTVVGYSHFEQLDAAELVEPRLLDSFLIFSPGNESFV